MDDLRRAYEVGLYYPALLVALTIPEICAALTLTKDVFVKDKHYIEFVEVYAKQHGISLDGVTCYRLRGGIVHRANAAGHVKFPATHLIFTVEGSPVKIHGLNWEAGESLALFLDLAMICGAMERAMHSWFADNGSLPQVVEQMDDLIRTRPTGIPPFITDFPVVGSGPERKV